MDRSCTYSDCGGGCFPVGYAGPAQLSKLFSEKERENFISTYLVIYRS